VLFAAHHWPRWGNARVQEILRAQRDLYAHMNNQVLHLANQGVTINQIHNVYELPMSLQARWDCRGYHGSPQHNSRGVVQRYLGFWDCDPATLIPLSPGDSAPLYVEMMGGAERILAKGRELHDAGQYKLAQEILSKLVHAEPGNQTAKDLLADVWEQIGYQQENPGLRNSFLAGAYELRTGIPGGAAPNSSNPDVIRAMTTELFLDFLGIRMDARKADGLRFTINLLTPDNGEKFLVELENGALTNLAGFQSKAPDLTLTINRADLVQTMMGVKTLEAQIADGTAKAQGDVSILGRLAALMVEFDPRFEVLPGTKFRPEQIAASEPFQAVPTKAIAE
jgi:alkyl sulfatase BDS1-like metallo-beta-lactamase superfamily hydrolase